MRGSLSLYPVFSSVLSVATSVFCDLSVKTQDEVVDSVVRLIESGSHVLKVELNISYAVRLLGCKASSITEETLARLYNRATLSSLIRRDIILVMAKWGSWEWLSDLKGRFRTMTDSERRAFIIASYSLSDEGKNWRDHIKGELSPFEALVRTWASERANQIGWVVPI